MTNKMKVLLGLVALAALSACGTPKFLVGDQFIGGRNIKYILRPVGGNDAVAVAVTGQKREQLYDFMMRICDYDGNDKESNCKDSIVVSNVVPGSIY